jgi:signal peptidase I
VNGQALYEPYVRHTYLDQLLPGDDYPPPDAEYLRGATTAWSAEMSSYIHDGELVVPPEKYFVMGDNREQSWDSRFWGFVPRSVVSGRPLLIYWSFETPRDEYMRNSLSDRLSQLVDMIIHFPTKTRWRRTLMFVR